MRITIKDLENLQERINAAAGAPIQHSTKGKDGRYRSNPGHYHLSGAYGGWQLQKITSEGGACEHVTYGYVPKKELYYQMQTFLVGLEQKGVK